MNKKAQSALEFLTTYGWVFLIALMMMVALVYFDIVRPRDYLPDRCFFTQAFCDDYKVSSEQDQIMLRLRNNLDRNVNVYDATILNSSRVTTDCEFNNPFSGKYGDDALWNHGERTDFIFENCGINKYGLKQKSKETFRIQILYRAEKSSENHILNGQLFTTVD